MGSPVRVAPTLALVIGLAVGGCSDGGSTEPEVAVALPTGSLAGQVLQPDDVPEGLVPLLTQTGPADISRIAGFSTDSATAEQSLREHGFDEAYVVQYGDQQSGRFLVNVVVRFDSVEGATADLTADLEAARQTGTPFPVEGLGDQAGGVRGSSGAAASPPVGSAPPGASPSAAPTSGFDLVTVRWRQDSTTWLLAVGARGTVEQEAVVRLARLVLSRAED